jgi:hypothetical protein
MFHVRRVLTQANLSSATCKQLKYYISIKTSTTSQSSETSKQQQPQAKPSADSIVLSDSAIKVKLFLVKPLNF